MSWVRERASNAAFSQQFSEARDFEIADRPEMEPAFEQVESESAPLTTEIRRPSRRNLLASMAVGLGLGVFLPIALFMPLYRTSPGNATELSSSESGIHVSISSDSPNLTVDAKAALVREIPVGAQPLTEAPSNNAQFVADQPIQLQPRQYLAIRSQPRLYQPEILLESVDGRGKSAKVTVEDLKILSGSNGRFRAPNGNAEWQGKWSFENSEKNLKIGNDYADYLDKAFDSSFGNKLSALSTGPTTLLSNIDRASAPPTGAKR